VTTEELDREVRLSVYRHVVRTGQAPALRDTSADVGVNPAAISGSLERLDASHNLVLHPTTRRLWMAMPFSAIPTHFRVTSGERAWWANCAWDALGISAMLQIPAEITTSCTDCGDPLTVRTTGRALADGAGVVHFAIPAATWWEDIGFT
jgi:Alkylmercury lyase